MTNKQKVKGSTFERLAVEILNKLVRNSIWKRIPGSGALGTILGEPSLTADIVGKVRGIAKPFKVEAKVGYGGATQLTLKKEWLDKVAEEAKNTFGIPMLIGKFSGAKEGVKVFVVMDVEVLAELVNMITDSTPKEEDGKPTLGTG